jgi:oxepin-CoA hydrolase/3-oxo-5,6-dehydrosuberyl-CoA semialdehyde dehydrogenase
MEADSLNCIVLEMMWNRICGMGNFVKEVRKEMTVKAGQKCTAIRRIFVPENKVGDMRKSITAALSQTLIGNPLNEKVRMGSLAGMDQRREVYLQVQKLLASSKSFMDLLTV